MPFTDQRNNAATCPAAANAQRNNGPNATTARCPPDPQARSYWPPGVPVWWQPLLCLPCFAPLRRVVLVHHRATEGHGGSRDKGRPLPFRPVPPRPLTAAQPAITRPVRAHARELPTRTKPCIFGPNPRQSSTFGHTATASKCRGGNCLATAPSVTVRFPSRAFVHNSTPKVRAAAALLATRQNPTIRSAAGWPPRTGARDFIPRLAESPGFSVKWRKTWQSGGWC